VKREADGIGALRPSRRPLRGLLRMRNSFNAIKIAPHPEEARSAVSKDARPFCRKWIVVTALCVAVVACDNMANQPKRLPFELPGSKIAEPHWPALPPAGTVARDGEPEPMPAPPLTLALLERGHERFEIACAPCHGRAGDGHGIIVERGFPAPPAFHIDRLRAAPVQHFYDVITHGYGAMFAYADRVVPRDRWAIAAYIRALQASGNAKLADVPAAKRQQFQ